MGTWGYGPFDNDSAADWCGDLGDAAPADRTAMLRAAFNAVLEVGDSYLDSDFAFEAVAAAALLASQLPGGTPVTSSYAPDFLTEAGGRLDVPADLPPLALRALDRILADDSEWRDLWSEGGELESKAVTELEPVRTTLQRAGAQGGH